MDINKLKKRISKNEKYSIWTFFNAHFTTVFSFGFAVFELVLAIFSRSTWYYSLFFYHIAITGMRLSNLIVIWKKKLIRRVMDEEASLKLYRANGIFLIVLNLIFAFSVYQMAFYGRNFGKPGILVYVYAGYGIYKFLTCISNMGRAIINENYGTRAIRIINFGDALVSVVAIQSALLLVFNDEPGKNGWYNLITGGLVCATMIFIGVLVIIKSCVRLVELRDDKLIKQGE